MKCYLPLLFLVLQFFKANSQSKFSIDAILSPKMSINNNTSISASYGAFSSNSEGDARSALGYTYDYNFRMAYTFGKNRVSAGIGRLDVRQMFRPSHILFGNSFKNLQKSYYFLQIPIDYEREVYSYDRWRLFAGAGITIATDVYSDIFKIKGEWKGYMQKRDGRMDENMKYNHLINYGNMETFNLLINASVKVNYQLNKHFSLFGGIEAKQGFRPLLTSAVYFERTNPNGTTTLSHVTSINNGQCVLMNIGVGYSF